MSSRITASMVLYHNPPEVFGKALQAFLDCDPDGTVVVVDNSSSPLGHVLFRHERVIYIYAGRNLGFGRGHNVAFSKVCEAKFHLLLNPDVTFVPSTVQDLLAFISSDPGIGAIMPRICFSDGSLQRLCKLLPTPFDLLLRRFIPVRCIQERRRSIYELDELPQDRVSDVPSLSCCFLLVRSAMFSRLGGFDERYFMYMEDVDLVRRIGDQARTVYYPFVTVEHEYAKGSYKTFRLLRYHVLSAWKYFSKWGWLLDAERTRRNSEVLRALPHALHGSDAAPT